RPLLVPMRAPAIQPARAPRTIHSRMFMLKLLLLLPSAGGALAGPGRSEALGGTAHGHCHKRSTPPKQLKRSTHHALPKVQTSQPPVGVPLPVQLVLRPAEPATRQT